MRVTLPITRALGRRGERDACVETWPGPCAHRFSHCGLWDDVEGKSGGGGKRECRLIKGQTTRMRVGHATPSAASLHFASSHAGTERRRRACVDTHNLREVQESRRASQLWRFTSQLMKEGPCVSSGGRSQSLLRSMRFKAKPFLFLRMSKGSLYLEMQGSITAHSVINIIVPTTAR